MSRRLDKHGPAPKPIPVDLDSISWINLKRWRLAWESHPPVNLQTAKRDCAIAVPFRWSFWAKNKRFTLGPLITAMGS
jgi:hypothetical protein